MKKGHKGEWKHGTQYTTKPETPRWNVKKALESSANIYGLFMRSEYMHAVLLFLSLISFSLK